MGRAKKGKAKKRLDAFYDLAKRQGFRARSAFKLIQLNKKYDFFKNCSSAVDLCAAPGGWMQVAKQLMPAGSSVIGVDLDPIKGLTGCKAILGDIYSDRTIKEIKNALKGGKVEVVLHDGSPNVGGVWNQEVFAQHQLVLQALKLATENLETGGWFITKVFRSENFNCLMWVFKQLFEKVEATKPVASRTESSEIYVVCHGYKNPHRVDPRFFKMGDVFMEPSEDTTDSSTSLFKIDSSDVTRNLHRRCSVMDFLNSTDSSNFVRALNEIHFDKKNEFDRKILDSTFTTKEILHTCSDLKQSSEADIKRLLRWKSKLSNAPNLEEKDRPNFDKMQISPEEDIPENIEAELETLRRKKVKERKKKMRKIVDRKLKHLGKVIHHDPFVVDDMGNRALINSGYDLNLPDTEMPQEVEQQNEDFDSSSDALKDKIEENLCTTNNFHTAIRQMLAKDARGNSKSHQVEDDCTSSSCNPGIDTSKREVFPTLRSTKPLCDVVKENLKKNELSLVKKREKINATDISILDSAERTEVLAMASEMLVPKKRRAILEDSIHRHTRGDEDLPEWFIQDEKRHYFRKKPVTKAAIDFEKLRFQEVNVRTSKKVIEAIARKRRKASKILRKVQKKGQTDPRMKEKGQRLSVRSLMRSKTLNKTKSKPMDNKMKGELYRNRQRKKRNA